MATIVQAAKDPWWAPLAVNILGGLWNDYQQREKNKKEAAYLGEIARMYNSTQNGQDNAAPVTAQDTGQGLLNTTTPERYNSDGWANAFHKTDTPLYQFDFGTANLATTAPTGNTAPATPLNAWANSLGNSGRQLAQFDANTASIVPPTTTTQPVHAPAMTPMEFYRTALELAGSKRFRMLNPDRVQNMLTPYIKLNEAARQEQLRNNLADDYMNAADGADRIRTVTGGALRGIVPESMANAVYNQNKQTPAHFDTGGEIVYGTTDGLTGAFSPLGRLGRTLTPQDVASNAYNNAKLQADIANANANRAYQYHVANQTYGLENRRLNHAERPTYSLKAMGDGKMYWVDNRNQTLTPVMNGDVHMDALPGEINGGRSFALDDYDRRYIESNNKKAEYAQKEINALEARRKNAVGDELAKIDNDIARKRNEIRAIQQDTDKYLMERRSQFYNPSGNRQSTSPNNASMLPPVYPPVQQYWTAKKFDDFANQIEKEGYKTKDGREIKTREELYQYLRENGIDVEVSTQNTPNQPNFTPASSDVTVIGSNDIPANIPPQTISPDVPSTISPDIPPIVSPDNSTQSWTTGNTRSNEVLTSDTSTDTEIQKALDELNEQLGEKRWADWATNFTPQNFSNNRNQPQQAYSGRYSGDSLNGGQYSSIINRQAKINNVDPDLIAAIIQQESGGNFKAVSPAGAQGLMQLMPQTARGLGVTNSFDPEQNIAGGAKYIAQMLRRYNGNIEKALWAYNAGPGNADKGRLPAETRKYIPSVMARYRRLKSGSNSSTTTRKRKTRR